MFLVLGDPLKYYLILFLHHNTKFKGLNMWTFIFVDFLIPFFVKICTGLEYKINEKCYV